MLAHEFLHYLSFTSKPDVHSTRRRDLGLKRGLSGSLADGLRYDFYDELLAGKKKKAKR